MNSTRRALISPRTFSVLILSIAFAFDRAPSQVAICADDSSPSRINPTGIEGTLFLVSGPLTEEILEQVSEADTDIQHVLALQLDSNQNTQQSFDRQYYIDTIVINLESVKKYEEILQQILTDII